MDVRTLVVVKGYVWNNEVGEEEMVLRGGKELEGKRMRTLCLGEEDVKHIVLHCSETGNWRTEFLNRKWSIREKKWRVRRDYVLGLQTALVIDLGRQSDKITCKWFNT